jgi:ubiquinone/menaquinone biosynthesis C-methylase UbiE
LPTGPLKKGYRGLPMEGLISRWYAKNTARAMDEYRKAAADVAARVGSDGDVLEVAPGPGYLAVELAKLGPYRVVGLDISRSFVRMATENAARAGVSATFHHGDAAAMAFEPNSFDFVVCRAAFKNFADPARALTEMHRVLRPGGRALILDLRRDATRDAIAAHVDGMGLGWVNSLVTKLTFRHMLLKRAYTEGEFREMTSRTPFRQCDIRLDPIGLEVLLTK